MSKITNYYRNTRSRGRNPYRRPNGGGRARYMNNSRPIGSRQNQMFALPNSYTMTVTEESRSGGGVTSQFDKMTVYRKKKMPWKKRKRWVGFVKKVRAAIMKDIGTKTVLRNGQMTSSFATDGQGVLAATLYGFDGAASTSVQQGQDDVKKIFQNDPDLTDPTAVALFASGVLDLTMTNTSSTVSNQNLGLEVDVYDIVFRRDLDGIDPINWLNSCLTATGPINSLTPQISLVDRGATLFEIPDAAAKGMKILSKKKYFLGSGEVATYQLRDSRNRSFRSDLVDTSDNNFVWKGATRTLIIITKGVPTASPLEVTKVLQVGVTRKYAYKIISKNTDQDNIIA